MPSPTTAKKPKSKTASKPKAACSSAAPCNAKARSPSMQSGGMLAQHLGSLAVPLGLIAAKEGIVQMQKTTKSQKPQKGGAPAKSSKPKSSKPKPSKSSKLTQAIRKAHHEMIAAEFRKMAMNIGNMMQ